MATALGTTSSSPNDRYAVTSNPFYDVDTEKYSRQISEKANEKKRAAMNGRTANGTSTVASSTVAADLGGVVRERWEKVHLSSEDERAKGSVEVSIVRLNENAFKMKMKLDCPSILNQQDALIHWGIIGPHDEDWKSPKHFVRSVPPNGREPDAQSEESKFSNGRDSFEHVFEFSNGYRGERVAMLIRSEDCETRQRDEGRRSHAGLDFERMAVDGRGSQQPVAATPAPPLPASVVPPPAPPPASPPSACRP